MIWTLITVALIIIGIVLLVVDGMRNILPFGLGATSLVVGVYMFYNWRYCHN